VLLRERIMKIEEYFQKSAQYLNTLIKPINDSKLFAGLVILTLNLSSKMITLPMSRTVESVIKHNFSQYILVFAIAWMGTREILVALTVTILFAICMEYLFNERSAFCCLSESFVSNSIQTLENFEGSPDKVSKEELDAAMKTLQKAQEILEKMEKKEDEE
jgi:hypothetical protein